MDAEAHLESLEFPILGRSTFRPTPLGTFVLVLALGAGLLSDQAAAQRLDPGRSSTSVHVQVTPSYYDIRGATAPEIGMQLLVRGPGASWTDYRFVYGWRYEAEAVALLTGRDSHICRPGDLRIELDFRVVVPRWIRPESSSEELAGAWEAFLSSIDRQWAAVREDYVARAERIVRSTTRLETFCPNLDAELERRIRESFEASEPPPDERPQARVSLSWPPDGFSALLAEAEASPAEASGGASPALPTGVGEPETEVASAREVAPAGPARPAPGRALPPDLRSAAERDLERSAAIGIVSALYHDGQLYLDAFGSAGPKGAPLDAEARLGVPAFTEILIAAVASGLGAAGVLDLDAPLSTRIPELSPGLGALTLRQLLEHRAGLDNAAVPDSIDWGAALDRLDDRALFTDPGVLASYSRYSYPLAARFIERAARLPIEEVIRRALLDPLGLASTGFGPRDEEDALDGLPVTYTTASDLVEFWLAWIGGELRGAREGAMAVNAEPSLGSARSFHHGFWIDRPGGLERLSLICQGEAFSTAFQVFPESGTVLVVWGASDPGLQATMPGGWPVERWPGETVTYMMDRVGGLLGIGSGIFGPVGLFGGGFVEQGPRRCTEVDPGAPLEPEGFGPPAPTQDWAGRYVNGDWFFELEDRGGVLVSPRVGEPEPYAIHHFEGDTHFAAASWPDNQQVGFPFRLFRGPDGRRYLMLGDRAYRHEGDGLER